MLVRVWCPNILLIVGYACREFKMRLRAGFRTGRCWRSLQRFPRLLARLWAVDRKENKSGTEGF